MTFLSIHKRIAILAGLFGTSALAILPATAATLPNRSSSLADRGIPYAQMTDDTPMGEDTQNYDNVPANEDAQNYNNAPTGEDAQNYDNAPMNEDAQTNTQQQNTQQQQMNAETSSMTIAEVASSNNSFSTLEQAIEAANLGSTLAGSGPYTVFAPTNEAFNELPNGALELLLQPENRNLLRQVLTYHVVPGEVTSNQLSSGVVNSVGGGLAVGVFDSGVVINNASVTQPDIQASNGVIHVVNRVLIPETVQQQLASQLGVNDIY